MRTIGQLCDEHRNKVSQGGKEPFYLTVVEPLLDEIEKSVDLKGSFELSGRFDVKAIAKFRKRDKISQALWIDYTAEAPDGGPSLMVWIEPEDLPEKFKSEIVTHPSGPLFLIPRNWTAADFSQIVRFDA